MSDWREVMGARSDADAIANRAEDNLAADDVPKATVYALLAVKEEIRALSVLLDFARGDAR